MAASPPARAAPSYSIDSFAEFSCFAVNRTPSTSAIVTSPAIGATFEPRTTQEQDEELFRDLFAADNGWEYPALPSQQQQRLTQKQAAIGHDHKASKAVPIWSTGGSGGGGGSPFLSAAFGSSPFAQSPSVEPPTLSAPVPRLNLAELMNARPGDGSSSNVWGGGLCQLPEEADEEDDQGDDSGESESRPESNTKPKAKSTSKLKLKTSKPKSTSDNNNNNSSSSVNSKLHQETLSFLEKLDLKALLHTPRPDVLDFYPTSSTGGPTGSYNGIGVSAANQFASKMDDPRVENLERDPVASICNAFNSSSNTSGKGKPTPGKAPGKKHTAEVSSRLSHMESTYGTTKSEPRKARKGTIERLANPILGYTSTLQALSPGQRRKRELMNMEEDDDEERGERGWKDNNLAASTKPRRKEPKEGSSNPLSYLTTSTQIYEATLSSSSQRLQKKQPAAQIRESTNNQLDDERDNSQSPPVQRKPTTSENKKVQSLSARKAALKKKIEEKQSERLNQSASEYSAASTNSASASSTAAAIAGATFLTQHEEEEEKLSSRVAVKRGDPQFRRPSLPPPISTVPSSSSELYASRQPRRPVSVRAPKKQEPLSTQSTQNPRRMNNNNKASDEREARGSTRKPQSKSTSVGKPTYREVHNKPKRPFGNRQQPAAPVATPAAVMSAAAPRKPSNSDMAKPLGRRPFPRPNAGGSSASGTTQTTKADPSVTSVPKRKQSVGKASTSEMLLMGAAGNRPIANKDAAATPQRGDSSTRKARKAQVYTPKKAHNNDSSTGSATPKEKPAARRPSRETAAAVAFGAERATKSSVVLPSIHPPKGKQPAESGVRRNFVYRHRTKAN